MTPVLALLIPALLCGYTVGDGNSNVPPDGHQEPFRIQILPDKPEVLKLLPTRFEPKECRHYHNGSDTFLARTATWTTAGILRWTSSLEKDMVNKTFSMATESTTGGNSTEIPTFGKVTVPAYVFLVGVIVIAIGLIYAAVRGLLNNGEKDIVEDFNLNPVVKEVHCLFFVNTAIVLVVSILAIFLFSSINGLNRGSTTTTEKIVLDTKEILQKEIAHGTCVYNASVIDGGAHTEDLVDEFIANMTVRSESALVIKDHIEALEKDYNWAKNQEMGSRFTAKNIYEKKDVLDVAMHRDSDHLVDRLMNLSSSYYNISKVVHGEMESALEIQEKNKEEFSELRKAMETASTPLRESLCKTQNILKEEKESIHREMERIVRVIDGIGKLLERSRTKLLGNVFFNEYAMRIHIAFCFCILTASLIIPKRHLNYPMIAKLLNDAVYVVILLCCLFAAFIAYSVLSPLQDAASLNGFCQPHFADSPSQTMPAGFKSLSRPNNSSETKEALSLGHIFSLSRENVPFSVIAEASHIKENINMESWAQNIQKAISDHPTGKVEFKAWEASAEMNLIEEDIKELNKSALHNSKIVTVQIMMEPVVEIEQESDSLRKRTSQIFSPTVESTAGKKIEKDIKERLEKAVKDSFTSYEEALKNHLYRSGFIWNTYVNITNELCGRRDELTDVWIYGMVISGLMLLSAALLLRMSRKLREIRSKDKVSTVPMLYSRLMEEAGDD